MVHPLAAQSDPASTRVPQTTDRIWTAITCVSLLLAVLVLIQHFDGRLWSKTYPLGVGQKINADGLAWKTRLPDRLRGHLADRRAVVLEDGVPLNHARYHSDAVEKSGGHYYVRHNWVIWAATDASDVRKNGRKYTVRGPWPLKPAVFVIAGLLLCGSLFMAVRAGTCWHVLARVEHFPWRISAGIVFALMLAFGLLDLWRNPSPSDGALIVKGMPESDASGWHDMALDLSEGQGLRGSFETQRPFYSVLMAGVFTVFGGSLAVAKVVNVLLLASAAAAVFALARSLHLPWVGLFAVAWLALGEDHRKLPHMILTENAGIGFGALGAWVFSVALQRRSAIGCGLAGLLAGFGNLASGVLLLAVPFSAILAVGCGGAGVGRWRRGAVLALCFTVGVSLVFLPWMTRQYKTHGVFTLAMNSAELLAGGADPVEGRLTKAMHAEAAKLGLGDSQPTARYHYFMDRFRNTVSSDPLGYAIRIAAAYMESLHKFQSGDPVLHTILALALLFTGLCLSCKWRGPQPLVIAACMLIGLANLTNLPVGWLLLPAFVGLLFQTWSRGTRASLAVVTMALISVAFLGGLSGNVATRRFWIVADWAPVLIIIAGWSVLLNAMCSFLAQVPLLNTFMKSTPPVVSESAALGAPKWQIAAYLTAAAYSTLCLAAVLITLIMHWRGPRAFCKADRLSQAQSDTLKTPPSNSAAAEEIIPFFFEDHLIHLRTGEDVGHWLPIYNPRSNPVWIAQARRIEPSGLLGPRLGIEIDAAQYPRPPRWKPMLWTGTVRMERDPLSQTDLPTMVTRSLVPMKLP